MIPNNIIIADESEAYSRFAAEWIAKRIAKIIEKQGRCSIALAGGKTPAPIYRELSESDLSERVSWPKLSFYFGDERCVPPDHQDSNYRMANEALLSKAPISEDQVFRIHGESPDREQAAADYAGLLPAAMDIILLGMGEDGHIASLFPGSTALDERDKKVLPVEAPVPPSQRITITPSVIKGTRTALVLISGEKKAQMLSRALLDPYDPTTIPAQLARLGTWIVDAAAAKEIIEADM